MRAAHLVLATAGLVPGVVSFGQSSFVNWESSHVHPLDLTPDGGRLLAVNTPDNRLEVFEVTSGSPVHEASIPVGLDPVSVRARHDGEAWVMNHVSDSLSVVDLTTGNVVRTLATADEPSDCVFVGGRAFVSCSQANQVLVFELADLGAPPTVIDIDAEEPRALAVSNDGARVYAAIFESGNGSTVLGGGAQTNNGFPPNVVNDKAGPYKGKNPPPNDGDQFDPPIKSSLPTPPKVALIVRKSEAGDWLDDNGGDWTNLVSGSKASKSGRPTGWDLPDRDVAVIDVVTLSVSYATRLMNINMALAVHPTSGVVSVIGTDGINEVRFEPNLNGRFLRVLMANVQADGTTVGITDLNPTLAYDVATIPQAERDVAIGDPRGIAWDPTGARAFITGMGSNNVVVVDAAGQRSGAAPAIEVGEGPTGVAYLPTHDRVLVLNKFESSISVIDATTESEVGRTPFYDPSPTAIKAGRRHLYDTHETSGLGHVSCASCHIDARMDRLAWDLGDPQGDMKSVAGQNLAGGIPGLAGTFEDWHPMKGPMTTQTLQDIIGKEPHHWRGDRDGIEEFNGAFQSLLGDDEPLTPTEMQEFEDFLATIHFPPNPFRNFDNTLPSSLDTGHVSPGRFSPKGTPLPIGDAVNGLALFRPPNLLDAVACSTCHTLPTGMGSDFQLVGGVFQQFPVGPNGEHHHALVSVDGSTNVSLKTPHMRNMHEKVGFDTAQLSNRAGFGFIHDGAVDTLAQFVAEPVFSVSSDQDIADLVAFMLAFSGSELPYGGNILEPPATSSQDSHAAVGAQSTLAGSPTPGQVALLDAMIALADAQKVGVVVKGMQADLARGYTYLGNGTFQSDRLAETVVDATLRASSSPGNELTYTVVPKGSETRIGVDRDEDGFLDRDELDAGSDPADPTSVPGACTVPAPPAPAGLATTTVSDSQIQLDWSIKDPIEEGFRVERSATGAGSFTQIADLPAGSSTYLDGDLPCSSGFDYRVTAFNCAGDSTAAVATGSTAPCPATPVHVDSIDVTISFQGVFKQAHAVVRVVDDEGVPVAGAMVSAAWTGSGGALAQSEITDAAGEVAFQSNFSRRPNYCFVVTVADVSGPGLVYDAGANVESSDKAGNACP